MHTRTGSQAEDMTKASWIEWSSPAASLPATTSQVAASIWSPESPFRASASLSIDCYGRAVSLRAISN
jgi:hypothetical protein